MATRKSGDHPLEQADTRKKTARRIAHEGAAAAVAAPYLKPAQDGKAKAGTEKAS